MATKRLIEIDIDWTQALRDTEAFLTELRVGIDQLVASGAAGGPGNASPTRVGIIAAQTQNDLNKTIATLNAVKIPIPKALQDLASGGLLKELQAIKFPDTSLAKSVEQMTTAALRETQKIGVSSGKQQALGGGEEGQETAVEKQLRKASDLRALTADSEYIAATVQYATELKLHTAALDAAKGADAEYIAASLKAAIERNLLTAIERETMAASEDYLASVVLAATTKNNLSTAERAALSADEVYLASVVRAATAKNAAAAIEDATLAGSEEYVASTALAAQARLVQAAVETEALAGSVGYIESLVRTTTAKNNLASVEKETLAADADYLASVRRAALAKKALADAEEVATFGIEKGGSGGSGGGGRGGFLGGLAGFGGGDAAAGLGARFASSAAFFASGIALFAITNSIRDSIKQAEGLQVQLSIIRSQLAEAGVEGNAAFERISDGILKVSKETATSADEVALVTRRLAGVFADKQGTPNFDKALTESADAFKLARVTGLPQQQITDSLVAISKAFSINFKQIGDLAIGLGQDFGQSEADIVTFTASLAPAAQELGFTATQLAGLGAVAEEFSGQSAQSLAENFRRVLPALQTQRAKIISLFDTSGHDDIGKSLADSFAKGNIEQVLEKIVKGYALLNTQQKEQLVSLAGGRREAGAFYSILENGDATLRALGTDGNKYVGDLDNRFAEVQKTVSFAFDEMKRSLQAFGVALFQSGIGDALVSMAHSGTELFNVASELLSIFGAINDLFGGLPGQIAGAVVEFLILQKVLTALTALKMPSFLAGLGGLFKGGGGALAADPLTGAPLAAAGGFSLAAGAVPLAGIGLLLGLGTLSTLRDRQGSQVDQGTAGIRDQITKALASGKTADQVRTEIRSTGTSGDLSPYEKFQNFINGANTDSPNKIAFDELEKQDKDRRGAALSAAADFYDKNAEKDVAAFQARNDKSQKEKDDYATKTRAPAQDFRNKLNQYLSDPSKYRSFADTEFDNLNVAPDFLTDPNKAKGYNPVFGIMQSALKDFDKKKKLADQVAKTQQLIATDLEANVANAQQQFESGTGSLNDYVAAIDAEAKAWQQQADAAVAVGTHDADAEKHIAAAAKQRQQAIKKAADDAAGLWTRGANHTGTDTGDRSVQIAQTRLNFLANNPESNPQDVINARVDLAQAEQDRFKAEVAGARTAQEKLAIINKGFKFSPEARLGLAQAEVLANSNELDKAAKALGTSLQSLANLVSQKMVDTGNDGLEILKELLRTKLQWFKDAANYALKLHNYQSAFQAIASAADIQKELDSLNTPGAFNAPAIGLLGNIGANDQATTQKQAAEEARTEALAAENARLDIQAAQARGNAIKLAELAQERAALEQRFARTGSERLAAQAHMIEAENQLVKAWQEYRKSLRGLATAQANNDPVVAAVNAVAQAEDDLAHAADGAEYVIALTALINAQHGAARALQDQADVLTNVDIARANLGGDPVKAAMLKLKELQDRLNNAVALGLNPTEIASLQAQILDATANLANTQISHGEQMIQNQLALGKINKGQAIAQLQALKVFAKNQDEIDQIDIEIKNLMNQVGQDFKFNLPSILGLPTLYESRRLGQSAGGTGGYQDNRQISVTVIASTNADPQQIASAVAGVFGPPNGLGVASRRY